MLTALMAVMNECRCLYKYIATGEHGSFTIKDGIIAVNDTYRIGQRIMVQGSLFNDGIYRIEDIVDDWLKIDSEGDENFYGWVYGMAIPRGLIELSERIRDYNDEVAKNPKALALTSESYRGYSYTRATGQNGSAASWKEIFASELDTYRRMFDTFDARCFLTPDLLFERDLERR